MLFRQIGAIAFFAAISSLLLTTNIYAQTTISPDLDEIQGKRIFNQVKITLSQGALDTIHSTSGQKFKFHGQPIEVNNVQNDDAKITLRGSSSLNYRRKSYDIKLRDKVPFIGESDTIKLKKFFAISLNMDRNYIRNAIALEVLSKYHISIPEHFYANVIINDSTEGVYMIYQSPVDYALKESNSPLVLRRDANSAIGSIHTKDISPYREMIIKNQFEDLYFKDIVNYNGQKLYSCLSRKIDIKSYFDWLSFNYLFENGDYTDEIFFYWDPEIEKFRIIPWDLDDLFTQYPHEGKELREKRIGNKLLFSSEDKLDVAIANDPVVYNAYLAELKYFLDNFTDRDLELILKKVYSEVYPYFHDPAIINQSKYDKFGLTNVDILKRDIDKIYNLIINRKKDILAVLQSETGDLTTKSK